MCAIKMRIFRGVPGAPPLAYMVEAAYVNHLNLHAMQLNLTIRDLLLMSFYAGNTSTRG
jgi:hypothetical protein